MTLKDEAKKYIYEIFNIYPIDVNNSYIKYRIDDDIYLYASLLSELELLESMPVNKISKHMIKACSKRLKEFQDYLIDYYKEISDKNKINHGKKSTINTGNI